MEARCALLLNATADDVCRGHGGGSVVLTFLSHLATAMA